jgi:hypothetical protein
MYLILTVKQVQIDHSPRLYHPFDLNVTKISIILSFEFHLLTTTWESDETPVVVVSPCGRCE